MHLKLFTIITLLVSAQLLNGQADTSLNKTDTEGRRQGHWTGRYPNGNVLYKGFFRDDYPEGELKRYYENQVINSVMIFSGKGREAEATIYYPDGSIAASGKYVDRMKEGKWKFYSSSVPGYLINEEEYSENKKNGLSLKFYSDSSLAEKAIYKNDKKEGEWIQYYANGRIFMKSNHSDGMLNGKFEVWYENGKPEISGEYKNNLREGRWTIYNEDGTIRYEMNYTLGMTKDRQMDIDAAEIIDNMEKNRGKITDPQNTGEIR